MTNLCHFFGTRQFSLDLSELIELTVMNLSFSMEFLNQTFSL